MPADDKMALYKSGITRFAQQDFPGALEDFSAALALDPEFGDAKRNPAAAEKMLQEQ